jgi:nucleotide-binding universal stress UspA family protein
MFRSLLVPLDGSQFSEQSIPTATVIARESGAVLHILHVHAPLRYPNVIADPWFEGVQINLELHDDEDHETKERYLERLARSIPGGIEGGIDTTVLDGSVSDTILEFAEESHADLIVLASHGHTGVDRLWLGSVTDTLVRQTEQPLLVLRPVVSEERALPLRFENVLVCLDGSVESEVILEPVRKLKEMGPRVTLLHVISEGAMFGLEAFPLPPDRLEDVMDRADEYLQSVARGLEADLGPISLHVERAPDPARGIIRVSQDLDIDLVAMATHGYGGLRRALLGSVADKVLRAVPQPVLLNRPC